MFGNILTNFLHKLVSLLKTFQGWLVGLALVVLNTVWDHRIAVGFTILVVLLDAIWGIAASIAQKRFAISELTRDTFAKLFVYGSVILVFCFIDKLLGDSVMLTTAVICGAIMLVELWSIAGNALIVFPNMPFLRLLRPALTGEIANKLHVPPEMVEQVLGEIHVYKDKKGNSNS